MKSFRNRKSFWIGLGVVAAASVAARGELARWVENIDGAGRLEAVFFRSVTLPGGAVPVRRPPKETRAELDKLIATSPADAELYALRALEAEQQLDFNAAENDWKKYSEIAPDNTAGRVAMADFYHRRLRPVDEFNTLALAAANTAPESEKLLPILSQRPSLLYERLLQLAEDQALPVEQTVIQYRLWIAHYPKESALYGRLHTFALMKKRYDFAEEASRMYERAIPEQSEYAVIQRAAAASQSGDLQRALSLYEAAFRPLWPAPLVKNYFELLKQTGSLRTFLGRARALAAAEPTGLNGPARLFYYYQEQGDTASAQRALAEFAQRKDSRKSAWTAAELSALAELYSQSANNWDRAARFYYALYSLPNASPADAERGLAGLAGILLNAPEQGVRFGSGNLSFWKDTATIDPHPGFLNGILSLVLNSSDPGQRYSSQNQASLAYFHRGRAAELLDVFDARFPASAQRPLLRARLIDAYTVYGESDATIREGSKFLKDFTNAPNRTDVASRLADAYAQKNQTQQEFALYEDLLKEFAGKANGVPIGNQPAAVAPSRPAAEDSQESRPPTPTAGATRSPEYARVLDRYLARLVSMKRSNDALALYRREIDRNPNDPGLYERLAGFLDQNKMVNDVEAVYQRAMQQFQDKSWSHKLARWYVRRKQTIQLDKLTQDVVRTFSGTELEAYFRDAVPSGSVTPAFYLQINKYAAQKFPHNLTFVRNLMAAYTTRPTADQAAYESLLRKNWYYADDLRARFFELLSRTNRLDTELQAIRAQNPKADQNPAAARLLAEGDTWRSHFELAAPVFEGLQATYPADASIAARAASIDRSLSAFDPAKYDAALAIEAKRGEADPRSSATLARIGEIEAERDRLDRAKPHWNRIAAVEPGKPDGYLEAATVFWDYYQFDDALRLIEEGRKKIGDPALYAYEAGAIQENKRDYDRAISEYARGALSANAKGQSGAIAESRLLLLARRPALRPTIDQLTANLSSAKTPSAAGFALRVALLRSQNRRDDLEKFLLGVSESASSQELQSRIENWGRIEGFGGVQQKALERQVALTNDPIDKMRARIALARFFESQGKTAEGGQTLDALVRDNPNVLGVIRAAVDYHARNKNNRRAVDLLAEAAGRGTSEFKIGFSFEAAKKATAGADYDRARALLTGLLTADPWNATYLAAMADSYGKQNDDRGLRAFYLDKLQGLKAASLPAADRNERIAGLRRGLIPVLARMKDYAGALDQYIEVINRFPEDESLIREAAGFADHYNSRDKLLEFYRKTQGEAPRDWRWPVVLARLETQFEDFPSAIASYTRAADIRPDRTDLLSSRADLEERLLRFDEAAKTYTRLYELTYHDSQWMDRLATTAARQGKFPEAIAALRRAWLEGRPDRAANYATVAERLESWNRLAEATAFAEEALKRADETEKSSIAVIFGRLAARGRRYESAYPRAPLATMADVAAVYYTPEEKTAFAAFLVKNRAAEDSLNAVRRAKFVELETKWLFEMALAKPGEGSGYMNRVSELQRSRLRFNELGLQLEAFWKALPADEGNRDSYLQQAADAYRSSGNTAAELRVLTSKDQLSGLDGPALERYLSMLLNQPQRLVAVAGRGKNAPQETAVVDFAVRNGTLVQATQAIEARGKKVNPLWTRAYTALAGVYFSSTQPATKVAFTQILNDAPIGARIGKAVDPAQALAGDNWYYFGARYGEYLAFLKQPNAEDYLPAELEHTPGRPEAYYQLAEYYRELGDRTRAAIEYRHTLELAPNRADVHDRLALLANAEGKSAEAATEWKLTFDILAAQQNGSRIPATFWTTLQDALTHAGQAKALAPLREDVSKLLRTYFRRNGSYQAEPLLKGILAASPDPAAGMAWITELSRAAADPPQFLSSFVEADWIPEAQKDALHQEILRGAALKFAQAFGDAKQSARAQQRIWQVEYVQFLLDRKQFDRARALLPDLQKDAAQYGMWDQIALEARIAARSRTMPALLDRLTKAADDPPPSEKLRQAATNLKASGESVAARELLKWTYERDLSAGNVEASTFIGLAEIRLEENDAVGAVALLRRMSLLSPEQMESLESAAVLLDRLKRRTEALEFADAALKAKPWDFEIQRRAADWHNDSAKLGAVLTANAAPYSTRAAAALAFRRAKTAAPQASSSELNLLAGSALIPEAAALAAFFRPAPLEAASQTADAASKIKLLTAALATDPQSLSVRQSLFDAAAQARRDRLTISVYESMMQIGDDVEFQTYQAEQFLINAGMDQPQRASVARRIAEARQRTGSPASAFTLFRIAERLEESDQAKAVLNRSIGALRAQVERRNANDRRRPMVTANIEQDHPVRPKLAAAPQGGAR